MTLRLSPDSRAVPHNRLSACGLAQLAGGDPGPGLHPVPQTGYWVQGPSLLLPSWVASSKWAPGSFMLEVGLVGWVLVGRWGRVAMGRGESPGPVQVLT